ncbi:hypothetical protein FOA52_001176 [Chlamydomonas sp. UWO 241]|nr:hypothetical protein FOA52_001176 [Chlamydomonas sp. UWO 241]
MRAQHGPPTPCNLVRAARIPLSAQKTQNHVSDDPNPNAMLMSAVDMRPPARRLDAWPRCIAALPRCVLVVRSLTGKPSTSTAAAPRDQRPDSDSASTDVEERKARAVAAVVSGVSGRSEEQTQLARLLRQHNVVVRGGPADGLKLLDALVAWRQGTWVAAEVQGTEEQKQKQQQTGG